MNRKLLILLLILLPVIASAQQLPIYSQYLNNPLVINPAIAGSDKYTSLRFTSRQQWIGIEGAPTTQVISMHSRVGRTNYYDRKGLLNNTSEFDDEGNIIHRKGIIFSGKEAIGGVVFNDRNGPINKTGIQMSYAFHFVLDRLRNRFNKPPVLSIGMAGSFIQIVFDESQLTLFDSNDPIITGSKESMFVPDINFGVFLESDTYYAGLSSVQILQPSININGSHSNNNSIVRHVFFMAGYKYETTSEYIIEPSILIKGTQYVPVQVDISTRVYLKNLYLGLSYRTNNDIVVLFGMSVGRYSFGYSFDYSTGNIIRYSGGSHEIVIGINIGQSVFRGYNSKMNL